jgi:integrase
VTPVLEDDQVLDLLEAIDTSTLVGLRDRALLGTMLFSWARVSAVCGLRVRDYESSGRKTHLFLGEKGGKEHRVLLHHKAEEYLDAYIEAAGIADDRDGWLFRSLDRRRQLSDRPLHRTDVLAMVKRRAKAAGLPWQIVCNHSFRATGITNYMSHGGRIDVAKEMAGHADERTTGLYDRSSDKMTKEEVERMRFTREGS